MKLAVFLVSLGFDLGATGVGTGTVHFVDASFGFRINKVPDQRNRHHEDGDRYDLFRQRFQEASFRDALKFINHFFGKPGDVQNQDEVIGQHPRRYLGAQEHQDVLEFGLVDSSGCICVGRLEQLVADCSGRWLRRT